MRFVGLVVRVYEEEELGSVPGCVAFYIYVAARFAMNLVLEWMQMGKQARKREIDRLHTDDPGEIVRARTQIAHGPTWSSVVIQKYCST